MDVVHLGPTGGAPIKQLTQTKDERPLTEESSVSPSLRWGFPGHNIP